MWRVSISVSLILSIYLSSFNENEKGESWYREGETVDGGVGGDGGGWVMMVGAYVSPKMAA